MLASSGTHSLHTPNALNLIREKHRRTVVLLAADVTQDRDSKSPPGEPLIEAGDIYDAFAEYCRQGVN